MAEDRRAEPSYWYLGVSPISVPYWSDVTMCEVEIGGGTAVAPMLFTAKEGAEDELREHDQAEADAYLNAVREYGAADVDEALDNTPEQQVFAIGAWLLAEHLKDSAHMYVVVDGRPRLAWELAEELGRLNGEPPA